MPWCNQMADIPFEGIFRRQIDLRIWDEHTVVGWLEDEFHHFGITLVHDGEHIRDVRIAAPRPPWTTCSGAGEPLRQLVGRPLVARSSDVAAFADVRMQCTHLFDLASLLVAHAHGRREDIRYHGTVRRLDTLEAGAPEEARRTTLYRNGREVMWWNLDDEHITAPAPYAGRSIAYGFRAWAEQRPVVEAEHALVLRRIAVASNGRRIPIEHLNNAAELGQGPICHTFQPGRSEVALPTQRSRRRFDHAEGDMLALATTKP